MSFRESSATVQAKTVTFAPWERLQVLDFCGNMTSCVYIRLISFKKSDKSETGEVITAIICGQLR